MILLWLIKVYLWWRAPVAQPLDEVEIDGRLIWEEQTSYLHRRYWGAL